MTNWTITKDKIGNGHDNGTVGPCTATMTANEIKAHPKAVKFRMMDDDGEIYYYGKMVGDENLFAPLDDFGMPNAGCTMIDLNDNGVWERL